MRLVEKRLFFFARTQQEDGAVGRFLGEDGGEVGAQRFLVAAAFGELRHRWCALSCCSRRILLHAAFRRLCLAAPLLGAHGARKALPMLLQFFLRGVAAIEKGDEERRGLVRVLLLPHVFGDAEAEGSLHEDEQGGAEHRFFQPRGGFLRRLFIRVETIELPLQFCTFAGFSRFLRALLYHGCAVRGVMTPKVKPAPCSMSMMAGSASTVVSLPSLLCMRTMAPRSLGRLAQV